MSKKHDDDKRHDDEAGAKKHKHGDHKAVAALLKSFGANLPHPDATMHGRYSFRPDDAWSETKIDTGDGWYTDRAWSIRIHDGKPKDAVRAGEEPEDAQSVV